MGDLGHGKFCVLLHAHLVSDSYPAVIILHLHRPVVRYMQDLIQFGVLILLRKRMGISELHIR
jgi:hypothetical protein